jgi:beta-mannosidase
LHYAARRFYKPVLLSIEDVGQTMHVHVTSDLIAPWEGKISWSLQKLTGEILESGEEPVSLAALESRKVLTRSFDLPIDQARNVFFLAELFQSGKRDSYALATFVPNKHLKLKDPDLVVDMSQSNDRLEISLTAQSLARFVELTMTDQDLIFSDNYFDLPANFPLRVSCPLPAGMTLDEARGKLRLMSLFDSY